MPKRTSHDPIAHAFGSAVRAARERRGERIDEVSRRIARMDSAYLAAIERGAHAVTIPTAIKIAAALEMDLSDLVRDLGPVSTPKT